MKKITSMFAGLLLLASTNAMAYITYGPHGVACIPGELCLFEDINYQGRLGVTFGAVQNVGLGGALNQMAWLPNDVVSSIINDSPIPWCVYTDGSFRGDRMTIDPWAQISNVGARFNDKISSVRPGRC